MPPLAGGIIWWALVLLIWIAIAFWPARVAGRKGHSFFGYFLFSLILPTHYDPRVIRTG